MSLEGPSVPVVAVGGVALQDGRVALIRRAHPPLEGRWTIPGGRVELGESLEAALLREMREETGLEVRVAGLLTAFDRIQREQGRVRYHYVIVDYWCEVLGGTLRAGSDAAEAAWVAEHELERYNLPDPALQVVQSALLAAGRKRPVPAVQEGP